jgi:hypothetical protein
LAVIGGAAEIKVAVGGDRSAPAIVEEVYFDFVGTRGPVALEGQRVELA